MNEQKKCIFHIPNQIDIEGKSGSNIRPVKMLEGFKENGYDVDFVMGYAKERKEQIKKIKKNIKNGIKYDFLYSESSTMPTILTEKNHLPSHPIMDFSFMKYCKKNGLKIGLFYRDIHWKFEQYKNNVPLWQKAIAIPCYKYDLYKYRKLLDFLYLPSKKVEEFLPNKNVKNTRYKIDILPPGCNLKKGEITKNNNKELKIFYVGGISEEVYNFEKLLDVLQNENEIKLTICCRAKEWEARKQELGKYLNDNIQIIHKSGEELDKYYQEADICSLLFKENEYMKIAMPVKLFEYLTNNKPIIATKGTVAGEFVEKNNIGWTIDYNTAAIKEKLNYLKNNREEIEKIKEKQKEVIKNNTWYVRAKKVINDLNI